MTEPIDRVAIGGDSIAYLERGARDGDLALCLHGFPDVPHSLIPVMNRLARAGFRAVAPYLRGYAPSTRSGPFGPLPLGADVLTLASALAPGRRLYVVGHDWGAVATSVASMLAPNRIAAAVTLSVPAPAAFARGLLRHPAQLLRSSYMLAFQLPRLPERALTARRGALIRRIWRTWSPGFEPPAALEREIARCMEASLPAPLAHYRALRKPSQLGFLLGKARGIRVPTLELHGADDGCIGAEITSRGDDFAADHERRVLPGAGHFLHVEAPDAVADSIVDWLGRYRSP